MRLSSHPTDISRGQWIKGFSKYLLGGSGFNETSGPVVNPKEGGVVRNAPGLGQVVGDDQNGVTAPQVDDEILNKAAGKRIKGAAGLIHEQHFRGKRQGSGKTEALLLAAGQGQRGRIQPILDFIPESNIPQDRLDGLRDLYPIVPPVLAQRKLDVSSDR